MIDMPLLHVLARGVCSPAGRSTLALAALLLASTGYADVYKCTNGRGEAHFTNLINDPKYNRMKCTLMVMSLHKSSKASAPSSYAPSYSINKGAGYVSAKSRTPFAVNERNRRRFAQDISLIANQHRLDPALLHAVISAESAFNPKAVSPKGATGLMQLMPATARRFGVSNAYDPIANIEGGARYLRWLLDKFNNNMRLALAGYNAGENAVIRYGHKIPPYPETQTYVSRVLNFYSIYQRQSITYASQQPPTVAQSHSGLLGTLDQRN